MSRKNVVLDMDELEDIEVDIDLGAPDAASSSTSSKRPSDGPAVPEGTGADRRRRQRRTAESVIQSANFETQLEFDVEEEMAIEKQLRKEIIEDSESEDDDEEDADFTEGFSISAHGGHDFSRLALKKDSQRRPLWVCPNRHIFLETFNPSYRIAEDFLISIAEPVCRPHLIHEYKLTPYSLYAAVSAGVTSEKILHTLNMLSKTQLDQQIKDYIQSHTSAYGKVKCVLKRSRYFIESHDRRFLKKLLSSRIIAQARVETREAVSYEQRISKKLNLGHSTPPPEEAPEPEPDVDEALALQEEIMEEQEQSTAENGNNAGDDELDFSVKKRPGHSSVFVDANASLVDIRKPKQVISKFVAQQMALNDETSQEVFMYTRDGFLLCKPSDEEDNLSEDEAAPSDVRQDADDDDSWWDPRSAEGSSKKMSSADLPQRTTRKEKRRIFAFEIEARSLDDVKKECLDMDLPILEEYDFRQDRTTDDVNMQLKPSTRLRHYQEKALSKMYGNGRARSGIIVLPCGAGKTLVGVTATSTMRKATLVLCNSNISVRQWESEFKRWADIDEPSRISVFTSDSKDRYFDENNLNEKGYALGDIVITTYFMLGFCGERKAASKRMIEEISGRVWGLLVLDEVHMFPAKYFRQINRLIKVQCSLGLTATLVREDRMIEELNFLVGPKLFEANWLDLQQQGYLAHVRCAEVWCPMPGEFYKCYIEASRAKRQLLYIMNPNKLQAVQYLVRFHESRDDKIIVFSDNVFALRKFAKVLNCPYIDGEVSNKLRQQHLDDFRFNSACKTIFISKVGDTSIDLPEANVIIQFSSHFGSRRQEAQRLGRILRPKPSNRNPQEYNAFYYSLVSQDTVEMYFSQKREQFLVDQGYDFKIITDLTKDSPWPLAYADKESQKDLLAQILSEDDRSAETEDGDILPRNGIQRYTNRLSALTGASGRQYGGPGSSSAPQRKSAARLMAQRYGRNFWKKSG